MPVDVAGEKYMMRKEDWVTLRPWSPKRGLDLSAEERGDESRGEATG